MKVAIQGIAGSFHALAAAEFFTSELELEECLTFRDVFESVRSGRSQRGVVAIENSLHGPINPVYRLLADQKLWVCGEVRLKIEMFLIGAQNTSFNASEIKTVLSQLPALEQCEQWLDTHLPEAIRQETVDTARSVRYVTDNPNEKTTVAIAGRSAADLYLGKILAGPINDDPDNYTRFVILSKTPLVTSDANRTSLILTEQQDSPGTLYKALGYFKEANINLSKLDSHPLPGKKRQYAFYIDFDEGAETETGKKIISQLQSDGWDVQILGSYKTND